MYQSTIYNAWNMPLVLPRSTFPILASLTHISLSLENTGLGRSSFLLYSLWLRTPQTVWNALCDVILNS
jgi:hypothetical protein